jgi:short-subunit dehydrogenase
LPDFKGKWALVTGASSGIGEAFAEELAREGANLILVARRQNMLDKLAQTFRDQYRIQAHAIPADLSKPDAPRQVFQRVLDFERPVEILVNNAGISNFGRFDRTSLDRNQELVMLNVHALVSLTGLFLPPMVREGKGIIITVSSLAAFRSMAYLSAYAASKAFALSFSEALWAELRESGVRVLAVCPGAVDTPATHGRMDPRVKMDSPLNVVRTSFRALDAGKCHVVPGSFGNHLMANMGRFLPRSFSAKLWEKRVRPRAALKP